MLLNPDNGCENTWPLPGNADNRGPENALLESVNVQSAFSIGHLLAAYHSPTTLRPSTLTGVLATVNFKLAAETTASSGNPDVSKRNNATETGLYEPPQHDDRRTDIVAALVVQLNAVPANGG
jgi:hypothetical protein